MTTTDDIRDILILCTRRPGADDAAFEAGLRTAAALCSGMGTELAAIMPASTLPTLAHVSRPDEALPDVILTVRGDTQSISAALSDMVGALAPHIYSARSSLLVTRRHAILPGRDTIRLFFGLRRLERLTLAEFHDYWLNHHAELGRRLIPPYTYHQLHTDPVTTAAMAGTAGLPGSTLDGVVEVYFPDIDAFVAQLSRPEVADEALADERNFIDHARSIFWAYRML